MFLLLCKKRFLKCWRCKFYYFKKDLSWNMFHKKHFSKTVDSLSQWDQRLFTKYFQVLWFSILNVQIKIYIHFKFSYITVLQNWNVNIIMNSYKTWSQNYRNSFTLIVHNIDKSKDTPNVKIAILLYFTTKDTKNGIWTPSF